eukprot:scaffold4756_cov116-Isochrysis_galbana.AAC.5
MDLTGLSGANCGSRPLSSSSTTALPSRPSRTKLVGDRPCNAAMLASSVAIDSSAANGSNWTIQPPAASTRRPLLAGADAATPPPIPPMTTCAGAPPALSTSASPLEVIVDVLWNLARPDLRDGRVLSWPVGAGQVLGPHHSQRARAHPGAHIQLALCVGRQGDGRVAHVAARLERAVGRRHDAAQRTVAVEVDLRGGTPAEAR